MTRKQVTLFGFFASASLALSGCNRDAPEPQPTAEPSPEEVEPVSIFRPDVEVDRKEIPMEPLEARVPFPEGGTDLSQAARAELTTIIESSQMKAGGAITLRGHTDSAGFDEANLRASQQRAEAVRDYLMENGIAEKRMTVIALGEMRPIAPNAKLDGSVDEEGRAANRRVDVSIAVRKSVVETQPATLIEAIAQPD